MPLVFICKYFIPFPWCYHPWYIGFESSLEDYFENSATVFFNVFIIKVWKQIILFNKASYIKSKYCKDDMQNALKSNTIFLPHLNIKGDYAWTRA